MQTFTYLLF